MERIFKILDLGKLHITLDDFWHLTSLIQTKFKTKTQDIKLITDL
jgi:hypothetical protein